MSIPHTGHLEAKIKGKDCRFDGDLWTCPDSGLEADLNLVTNRVAKTHLSIKEVATSVIDRLGLENDSEILKWEASAWSADDDLPDGAID